MEIHIERTSSLLCLLGNKLAKWVDSSFSPLSFSTAGSFFFSRFTFHCSPFTFCLLASSLLFLHHVGVLWHYHPGLCPQRWWSGYLLLLWTCREHQKHKQVTRKKIAKQKNQNLQLILSSDSLSVSLLAFHFVSFFSVILLSHLSHCVFSSSSLIALPNPSFAEVCNDTSSFQSRRGESKT